MRLKQSASIVPPVRFSLSDQWHIGEYPIGQFCLSIEAVNKNYELSLIWSKCVFCGQIYWDNSG